MAISFPSSPSTDDVYLYNGIRYIFDGTKWVSGGQSFDDSRYAQVSGDTFTGDVTITDTTDDSAAGPEFSLKRESASPDDGDYLGQIRFDGKNSNGGDQLYAKITGKVSDVTLSTEDGLIEYAVVKGGSQTIVARQTGTALKLLNGTGLEVDGHYQQTSQAVAALDIDCSTGNYFTKSISADSTFTFSNAPSTGTSYSFILELTVSGDRTITWPTSVKFNDDTAPTLSADKTHLFIFITDDGGTRFRGAALVDYVA